MLFLGGYIAVFKKLPAVSIPPTIPSSEGLPSKLSNIHCSTGEGLGGLGPPPVFGLLSSNSLPFAIEIVINFHVNIFYSKLGHQTFTYK